MLKGRLMVIKKILDILYLESDDKVALCQSWKWLNHKFDPLFKSSVMGDLKPDTGHDSAGKNNQIGHFAKRHDQREVDSEMPILIGYVTNTPAKEENDNTFLRSFLFRAPLFLGDAK